MVHEVVVPILLVLATRSSTHDATDGFVSSRLMMRLIDLVSSTGLIMMLLCANLVFGWLCFIYM